MDNAPKIWYPGDRKHVIIQISNNCNNDLNRAVFEVAHEAIHCLSPTGQSSANVLEEGLANLFSIAYSSENGHGAWTSDDARYTFASEQVKALLFIDADIIKQLRKIQPTISLIDETLIRKVNPNVPGTLAAKLTQPF